MHRKLSIGAASRACKGKTKGKFRACLKAKMRSGRGGHRRRR